MFVYEWTIKDDDENEHLVKLKRDGRDNLIYLDDVQIDAIPNDFHHSPIFNYEYNFEILGKRPSQMLSETLRFKAWLSS